MILLLSSLINILGASALAPTFTLQKHSPPLFLSSTAPNSVRKPSLLFSVSEPEDDTDEDSNPYANPDYPELEFIDYSDPNYQVDQGVSDEFFPSPQQQQGDDSSTSTEEQIEEMREDRRRRNDEFQFQTYFKETLKEGDEFKGEWTVYKTSTFLPDVAKSIPADEAQDGVPRLVRAKHSFRVASRAYKTTVPTDSPHPVDAERIRHEERIVSDDDIEDEDADADVDSGATARASNASLPPDVIKAQQELLGNKYWPDQLKADDFRGEQGIMCVGNGYTIATGVALVHELAEGKKDYEGPFEEYRTELGLESKGMRFRLKFDYSVKENELDAYKQEKSLEQPPPLHLKSMTVCRETMKTWPSRVGAVADALFGAEGAPGGLYDPPPVGSDEQAGQYMVLDLEGRATALFPYQIDQDPAAFDGKGWVTSLDWTPGSMRYQLDRKVKGGADLLGLRTLELSEVQSADAEQYRPRDGGTDMRQ